MSKLTISLRGAAALGVTLILAACAPESARARAETPAPKAAPALTVPAAAPTTGGAVGPVPAGWEELTVVTPTGRTRFFVEIADTEPKRQRGLMFRKEVPPDRGMLFDMKQVAEAAFWMKNTLIPLDIIYIRPDGSILSIARNTTPLSEAPIPSGGPILGVLELAGGRAGEIGLMPGDKVEHRIFRQ